ncbi:hypothetical protein L1987_18847 [Smallanthus sonchifolius]|uniref:Uncharacterized protein n=1 Tax=Smallanthus sonchifolius TaxID=185202 RepID=A0ACB9J199_9ASTR|nr:hypothetical protein L1987_18847 [Smallanthus sonchifolius]
MIRTPDPSITSKRADGLMNFGVGISVSETTDKRLSEKASFLRAGQMVELDARIAETGHNQYAKALKSSDVAIMVVALVVMVVSVSVSAVSTVANIASGTSDHT